MYVSCTKGRLYNDGEVRTTSGIRCCTKVLPQHDEWQQVYARRNLLRMPESYGLVLKYGVPKQRILFGNSIIYSF